jgi:hypothetical protein
MFRRGRFRIEHRDQGHARVIGYLSDVFPHHTALEVYIPKLLAEGVGGWAVMVDETTETVVARRRIRASGQSQRPKPGPTGPRRTQ